MGVGEKREESVPEDLALKDFPIDCTKQDVFPEENDSWRRKKKGKKKKKRKRREREEEENNEGPRKRASACQLNEYVRAGSLAVRMRTVRLEGGVNVSSCAGHTKFSVKQDVF